jgi:hypothetical protein
MNLRLHPVILSVSVLHTKKDGTYPKFSLLNIFEERGLDWVDGLMVGEKRFRQNRAALRPSDEVYTVEYCFNPESEW